MRKVIAVWFSCGAASAVAAKLAVDIYGNDFDVRVINNPVKEEHHDNKRFLLDIEKWIGRKIEFAVNPQFESCSAYDVWEKRKYMSGVSGAPCTFELKKKARQLWEKENKPDFHVLGFTFEEINRHKRFVERERENVIPVLIDNKIRKNDCFKIISDAGIKLPEIYTMGYPNANCIGCVKATSASYWQLVREKHCEIFQERCEQSKRLGVKLVRYKGKRVFLDELPLDAKGRKIKSMDFECGIFCEEKM